MYESSFKNWEFSKLIVSIVLINRDELTHKSLDVNDFIDLN